MGSWGGFDTRSSYPMALININCFRSNYINHSIVEHKNKQGSGLTWAVVSSCFIMLTTSLLLAYGVVSSLNWTEMSRDKGERIFFIFFLIFLLRTRNRSSVGVNQRVFDFELITIYAIFDFSMQLFNSRPITIGRFKQIHATNKFLKWRPSDLDRTIINNPTARLHQKCDCMESGSCWKLLLILLFCFLFYTTS
jgi:hypothetical protein